MRKVLAIDPGCEQSAYCIIDMDTLRPLEFDKIDNEQLMRFIKTPDRVKDWRWIAIEMVTSYGMSIGQEVMETIYWIGRFHEALLNCQYPVREIRRMEEKRHICHSTRANDATIRRALIDRFATHDLKNGKGTKSDPDFFFGFKADVWAAYAVGLTAIENRENDYKFLSDK